MPVRWVIHSSEVAKHCDSRWLSTTQSGTAIPVPMIFDFFICTFRRPTAPPTVLSASEQCQGKESRALARLSRVGLPTPPTCSAPGEARRPLLEERSQPFAVILPLDHHALDQSLPRQAGLEVEGERAVEQRL